MCDGHLLEKYSFLPIDVENDADVLIQLCLHVFLKLEPHSRSMQLGENSTLLIKWIVLKSLHSPFCLKVVEKSTGKIVAARIISVSNRDKTIDWEPFQLKIEDMEENVGKIADLLDNCTTALWESIDQNIEKILYREISFVLASHQRQGIAQAMLEYGLNFEELRKQGFQGIGSVATSIANQNLLLKNGYKCVFVPEEYDWKLDDGTKTAKVLFKDIR